MRVAGDEFAVDAQHHLGLLLVDDGGGALLHHLPPRHLEQRQRPKALRTHISHLFVICLLACMSYLTGSPSSRLLQRLDQMRAACAQGIL